MAALVTTGISTRNLIPTSEYDNASLQHMLTLDSQERLNDSEMAIIKCVWEGNIEEIKNLLTKDPSLLKTEFKGTIISKYCIPQNTLHIESCSLLHLACFTANEKAVELFASRFSDNIRFINILMSQNTLEMIVNLIDDIASYHLVHNALKGATYIDLEVREIIPLAISKGKNLTLESCFKSMCQDEMGRLPFIIQDSNPKLTSDNILKIITDYTGYVLNSRIITVVNHQIQSRRIGERKFDDIRYHTPLAEALNILKTPSLKSIEVLRLILMSGGNLNANYEEIGECSANIRIISIRDKYKKDFPRGYFNRLLDHRISSHTLLEELINPKKRKCVIM